MLTTHLVEHVRRQAHHGKVVHYEDDLQVDGLPVSHEPGAEPHHTEVEEEDDGDGDGGVDQQPRVCPFIWDRTDRTDGTDGTLTYAETLLQPCRLQTRWASKKVHLCARQLLLTLLVAGTCFSYREVPRCTSM